MTKQLTQDVFSLPEYPPWAKSAAVDIDGVGGYFAHTIEHLTPRQTAGIWGYKEELFGARYKEIECMTFSTTNWQQSAIDRE